MANPNSKCFSKTRFPKPKNRTLLKKATRKTDADLKGYASRRLTSSSANLKKETNQLSTYDKSATTIKTRRKTTQKHNIKGRTDSTKKLQ